MSTTNPDADREKPVKSLEWMQHEFLAAQQRRRDRMPAALSRHDDTGSEPPQAGPVPDKLIARPGS